MSDKKSAQSIIRNMGLFWRREEVNWGAPGAGNKRNLLGVKKGTKRNGPVDFWNQTGIYALYDSDYRLVYVGQAGFGSGKNGEAIGSRLRLHKQNELAGRWEMFSWFGLRGVNKDGTLGVKPKRHDARLHAMGNVLEGILIEVAEPFMNKQKGKLKPADVYLQDRREDKDNEILREITKLQDMCNNNGTATKSTDKKFAL